MKRKIALLTTLLLCLAPLSACSVKTNQVSDPSEYDLKTYMKPIWEGDTVYAETAFVLKEPDGSVAPIRLLYDAKKILSVRNFALDTLYEEGKDYSVEKGKLVVKEDGAIYEELALDYGQYYLSEPTAWSLTGINGGGLLKTEIENGQQGLTKWQIAVTYTHTEGKSALSEPQTHSEAFEKTVQKLQKGESTNIVCLGDSISAGWSASGFVYCNIEPYCPNYFTLFTDYLADHYKNDKINADNYSVGGMKTDWGGAEKQIASVTGSNPDLLILAFGMNDGVAGGFSVEQYKTNTQAIIDGVRKTCPETEIMLVSPMLPNAEVANVFVNQYAYLAALNELAAENESVAVADVTTACFEMLSVKKFRDFSANNVNHPNDFFHRVYAQVAVKTLADIL